MADRADEKHDILLTCRDMAELVTPYVEGALPRRTRLAARFHLLLCEACRRYVAQMRRTIRFLGSGPPPSPPQNENDILALIEASRREP
jgi:anti-sigma factor RsiW